MGTIIGYKLDNYQMLKRKTNRTNQYGVRYSVLRDLTLSAIIYLPKTRKLRQFSTCG